METRQGMENRLSDAYKALIDEIDGEACMRGVTREQIICERLKIPFKEPDVTGFAKAPQEEQQEPIVFKVAMHDGHPSAAAAEKSETNRRIRQQRMQDAIDGWFPNKPDQTAEAERVERLSYLGKTKMSEVGEIPADAELRMFRQQITENEVDKLKDLSNTTTLLDKKTLESFSEYAAYTRNAFGVNLVRSGLHWETLPSQQRVVIEDMLIAYDQLLDRVKKMEELFNYAYQHMPSRSGGNNSHTYQLLCDIVSKLKSLI